MLELVCPSCERHFGVAENAAGEPITCPYCASRTRAPEPVAVLANAVAAKPTRSGAGHDGPFWTPIRATGLVLILLSVGMGAWALIADYSPRSAFSKMGGGLFGLAIIGGLVGLIFFAAGGDKQKG